MNVDKGTPAVQLLSIICAKSALQAKALSGLLDRLSQDGKDGLNALLEYYIDEGDKIEHLADCYLHFINDLMKEQLYFIRNGHYRYSSSDETNDFFYQNPDVMEYYMKGLAISQYLIDQHISCHEWYCKKIRELGPGEIWLEGGVGHGENFVQAVRYTNYKHYYGIDISPTSVKMTKEMIEKRAPERKELVEVKLQDFFKYNEPICDALVFGEILEHVDKPRQFLEKIYEITHENSFIFITTVVNGPAIDHVYLFRNVDELEALYQKTGFDIVDKQVFPSHGYSLEKAMKMKAALVTAHVLKKKKA